MVSPNGTPDTSRNGILDRGIQWLLGRQRPLLTVTSPNGGETITTASFDVTWNETAGPGRSIAARTIQYSLDGGDSWITLTTSAGPSPYNWNAAGVPNSPAVLLRVRVTDDGTPALGALDVTNATFALQRAGEDTQGPVVVAGSIEPDQHRPAGDAARDRERRVDRRLDGRGGRVLDRRRSRGGRYRSRDDEHVRLGDGARERRAEHERDLHGEPDVLGAGA
jgi:hypothetical protein